MLQIYQEIVCKENYHQQLMNSDNIDFPETS